jgi:signal transduction histidine kinase
LGNGLFVSKRLLNQINAELIFKSNLIQHKTFEIVIKDKDPKLIVDSRQIEGIKENLNSLSLRLSALRNHPISKNDQELMEKEFHRQTSIFTNRLTNKLTIIESMILDSVSNLDKNDIEFSDALKKIAKNCTYCRLLTRNILEIGGSVSLKLTTVSLIEVVEEVLSLIDRKMPMGLYSVEFEVDPKVDDIEADALQLMQVFMNLIRNAIDAMPHGGKLGIHIGELQDEVFVRILDTGTGISPEIFQKLFKIGFSTKPGGYGIGLYSVKNIIDKHDGTIEVTSNNGKGTIFTVYLPIYQTSRGLV